MSQRYDFKVMRHRADFYGNQSQFLYLLDPDVDRFPYGSRELTGKQLERLRALNRRGFSMGYEPGYDERPGILFERIMLTVAIVIAVVGLIGLAVALLSGAGVLASVSAGIGFVSGVSTAYLIRSRDHGPNRVWDGGLSLYRAIHGKRVEGCKEAGEQAEALRYAWRQLLESPEWNRLGEQSQYVRKREMDRLLFGLAVATATDDPNDQKALLEKLRPEIYRAHQTNLTTVDPARSPREAAKELLGTGPAPDEPATVEIDYAPQVGYAPYPSEGQK